MFMKALNSVLKPYTVQEALNFSKKKNKKLSLLEES